MTHREAIKEWLGNIRLKDVNVIDWGSGSKPVTRYIQQENCQFITIDKNPLIAPDRRASTHVKHDIQKFVSLPTADVAFCIEVLEHTIHPDYVLKNIYQNLKEGGVLYLSMPYDFRVHSDDDYFRLTINGMNKILEIAGFTPEYINYSVNQEGYLVKATK